MAPLFFLSYCDHSLLNAYYEQFYDDLAMAVVARKPMLKSKEDAGFFDAKSIGHAHRGMPSWREPLQTCKVFVYIQSEEYFDKANTFCGKEWWAFRERVKRWMNDQKAAPDKPPPLFLPVLWLPAGTQKNVPAACAYDIQNGSGSTAPRTTTMASMC